MKGAAWRCFVAVPPPDEVRSVLRRMADRWHAEPVARELRLVPPERWHLTLAFLGDLDPSTVPAVEAAVRDAVASSVGIEARLAGAGAFPTPRRARVVWTGIADPSGGLRDLVATLRRSLRIGDGDPFHPHVTLGRARRGPVDVAPALRRVGAGFDPVSWPIDRVELMRSHRGTTSRYETLVSTRLSPVTADA